MCLHVRKERCMEQESAPADFNATVSLDDMSEPRKEQVNIANFSCRMQVTSPRTRRGLSWNVRRGYHCHI